MAVSPWPSPKAKDGREWSPNAKPESASGHGLGAVAQTAGWPTPDAQGFGLSDSTWEDRRKVLAEKHGNNGFGLTLGMAATLASGPALANRPTPDTWRDGGRVSKDPLAKTRPSGGKKQFNLNDAATLAGCSSPRATDGGNGGPNQAGGALPADAAMTIPDGPPSFTPASVTKTEAVHDAELTTPSADAADQMKTALNISNVTESCTVAGWASPSSRDWKDSPGMATTGINPDGSERDRTDQLPRQAQLALAGWPTPMAGTPETETNNAAGNTDSSRKTTELILPSGSPTPKANEKIRSEEFQKGRELSAMEAFGEPTTSSSAETASGGESRHSRKKAKDGTVRPVLNPYFSGWLQGFPAEWCDAGIRASASTRSRPRKSRGG